MVCQQGGDMDLTRLFYPSSLAVVGASPNLGGGKVPYYQFNQAAGFKGKIYPVNPAYQQIDGIKVYPSLADIPETVDYAIFSVPARLAIENLKIAVDKGIPFVHFFTSGFSETGNSELEAEMLDTIKGHDTHIVGPNCFGTYCWEAGLTYSFRVSQSEPGSVAFLGQSGSLSDLVLTIASARGIPVNKAVSYGNQIDLKIENYLDYLADDNDISVIAAYVEDIKNGSAFLNALKKACSKKRVIIMKGGITQQGARAAQSHTGALMQSGKLFSTAVRQAGCITVQSFEELMDTVMTAVSPKQPAGNRVGYVGGGGGISVIAADVCWEKGLVMPSLATNTVQKIKEKTAEVNTSFVNPVDLGAFGYNHDTLLNIIEIMAADHNLDILIPQFIIGIFPTEPAYDPNAFLQRLKQLPKPVFPIISTFSEHNAAHLAAKSEMFRLFRKANLPVFNNIQEAATAVRNILSLSPNIGTIR